MSAAPPIYLPRSAGHVSAGDCADSLRFAVAALAAAAFVVQAEPPVSLLLVLLPSHGLVALACAEDKTSPSPCDWFHGELRLIYMPNPAKS